MGWQLAFSANISYVPDGAGPMTVPSMQTLEYTTPGVLVSISGTTALPSATTINAACSSAGSLVAAQFGTISLATVQGWATGSP